ncbi:MAG TPA: hypothetical protein VH950_18355 [Gaiellaceae bacterium]
MRAIVDCALGRAVVDLDDAEIVELTDDEPDERPETGISLPLLVDADRHGSRVVAVVDRRPPIVVSDDAGVTWREAGGGLPPGRAVAISPEHPDLVLFASENRLHVSRDGGRFWQALALELPSITRVQLT